MKNPEIYKFLIVGVASAISTLSLTVFFTSVIGIFYVISVAVSLETTLIWSYFIHDKWTFNNVVKISNDRTRFIKYNVVALCGIFVNIMIMFLLTEQLRLQYVISEAIAIIITFFFNYILHKKISWKS